MIDRRIPNIVLRRKPSLTRVFGFLVVTFVLTSAGNSQVSPSENPSGALSVTQPQEDTTRLAAQRAYIEGQRLILLGTSESMLLAVKKFEEALALWRKLGDRAAEAVMISYIAKAYDLLGEKQKALEYYEAILPMLRETGDLTSEAITLNNIGLIHDSLGEKRKALELYDKALVILESAKDQGAVGITLVNIGLAHDGLGEKQKAIDYYLRALPIFRSEGDRNSEAVTLNNLGRVYDSLGDKQRALDFFGLALPILKEIGNKRVEAVTLNNIGYVFDSLDEKQKALNYYELALPVLRASGDRFKEAVTINNIGLVYRSLGQFVKALDYFGRALKLRQTIGDRPGEAETHGDLGVVYESVGDTQKALASYNESLRLSRAVEDHAVEASTLRRLALVDEKLGKLSSAREKMEAAIVIIETLRTRITGQELRDSYFASIQDHFESYITLLMRMHIEHPSKGYDALALRANERARARGMLDMLIEARADIRQGVTPLLLERERALQNKLREAGEKQTRLSSERSANPKQAALRKETSDLLSEYQQVEAEIRTASPRYAALTQPVPLGVKEIQQQTLDPNTMLLEYALGEKKSFLWAVTSTSLKSFELPPRKEIETTASRVYVLLTSRNQQIKFETSDERATRVEKADRELEDSAFRLSQMLLGPIAAALGTKRLLIVGDGVLNYIPFAALPSPEVGSQGSGVRQPSLSDPRPMIVDHEVVALPSASTLAALRREMSGRRSAEKTLAVIADPVFEKNDPRIKRTADQGKAEKHGDVVRGVSFNNQSRVEVPIDSSRGSAQELTRIQRLPFTRFEADQILSLVPATESKRAVDFDANREVALSPELGKYRFVHFATHGVLNSQHPELSGLVLSLVNHEGENQDGFLWAHEVYNLHLPVEMVVLSGCRTGLGKEIRGEGLVGLTRGFMYAGARRVVVSLWDISDEASAELMTQFYTGILGKDRLRPAAALRSAQIAIWKTHRWRAPYYWAAFVIQGEAN